MKSWKRALIFGSLGAGAFLLITGRRSAGAALTGIGVAALASEYPEKLQACWERAPECVRRGTQMMNTVSAFLDRLAGHKPLPQESGPNYVI